VCFKPNNLESLRYSAARKKRDLIESHIRTINDIARQGI